MAKVMVSFRTTQQLHSVLKKTAIDANVTSTEVLEKYLKWLKMKTFRQRQNLFSDKSTQKLPDPSMDDRELRKLSRPNLPDEE